MSGPIRKTKLTVPVAITPGRDTEYRIHADLHEPENNDSGAIQVLLHGGLFNRLHWDFPYNPERYSYVRYMAEAGWPCLAMDRIGNGESSRPPSSEVSLPNSAYTVHQIVQALRTGEIGGTAYERVVLVGHSTGSAVASIEANRYGDVDGLLLTGWAHGIPDMGDFKGWTWHCPTSEEPKFRHLNLDEGYITIRPGAIGPAFYNVEATEPKVLEVEEEIKDTYCILEGATIPFSLDTHNFRGAVFIANGMLDPYPFAKDRSAARSSAAASAFELPHWHPDVDLQTLILPRQGHVLNTTAGHVFFNYALAWANAFVGRDAPALRSKVSDMDSFGLSDLPEDAL